MPWGAVVDMQRTLGSRPRQLLPHSSGVFLAGTRSQCRICSSRHSYSGTCFVYNHIVCVEVHRDSQSSVFSLLSGYHFSSKKSDRHACIDRAWAVEYAPSLLFNASNLDRCMGLVVDDLTIRLVDGGDAPGRACTLLRQVGEHWHLELHSNTGWSYVFKCFLGEYAKPLTPHFDVHCFCALRHAHLPRAVHDPTHLIVMSEARFTRLRRQ